MGTTSRTEHLLTLDDLGAAGIRQVLARAAQLKAGATPRRHGLVMLSVFLEPSVRTRVGFSAAAARAGIAVVELDASRHGPGMSAPESWADAMRCASGQVDVVVLRDDDDARFAGLVEASVVPVINAGGLGAHPTQTLIDLFAMTQLGTVEGLRIGLVGDMGMRCAKSLQRGLGLLGAPSPVLMHPPGRGPERDGRPLDVNGLDVLYVAGLPERRGHHVVVAGQRAKWAVTVATVESFTGSVLCPLPRVDEIDVSVDEHPRAAYFRQADDSRYVRTALLEHVLDGGDR